MVSLLWEFHLPHYIQGQSVCRWWHQTQLPVTRCKFGLRTLTVYSPNLAYRHPKPILVYCLYVSISTQCQPKAQLNHCYRLHETVITSHTERWYLNWSRVNTLNSYSLPRFSGSESAFTSKKRPSISQTAGKETVFNIAATTFYHLTHRRRI